MFQCLTTVFQVHAYIVSSLRKDMPSVFGKDGKKKELIKNLDTLYAQIQREHQVCSLTKLPNLFGWMESYLLKETESILTTAFLPFEPDLLKVAEISNALERCL